MAKPERSRNERLKFGTAGLRAPLGDGPLEMNVRTVELAATALAQWLPVGSTIIIGRDARHGSEDFAHVTARVLAEHGHVPRLFAEPVPTPVVAYTVANTNAAGGVVVTASHNPATDNGYKVYAADGSQILPADAALIEASMDALPWPDDVSTELPSVVEILGSGELDSYSRLLSDSVDGGPHGGLTIAYTAMHGVGGDLCVRVLEQAGHRVASVPEQHRPDPDFPTAPFPNPEEPGTLDLVSELAQREDADVIFANDPDADRLAVAVRRTSKWERLTGDQIGAVLGAYVLDHTSGTRCVATTIVSSSLLTSVAEAAGVPCHRTLTGFKWLVQMDSPEEPLVFAYEEALGYSVLPAVRDKDGISAALLFARLVAELKADGKTVDDRLDELYAAHGVHLTSQVSSRFDGDEPMAAMTERMADFRSGPPTTIAEREVNSVVDLLDGTGSLPASDVLIYELDGARVVVRPSGTEPKIKAYLEVVTADRSEAREQLVELEKAAAELIG